MNQVIEQAQEFMARNGLQGWLLYDYRHMNPIFWEVVGQASNVTRPSFLWVPAHGQCILLAHHLDAGRFQHLPWRLSIFRGREELITQLTALLKGQERIAMEYSPMNALPRASRVDAGTVELVRSLGPTVVSSADLLQFATQRWQPLHLASHRRAAQKLGTIILEAFQFIGRSLEDAPTEFRVAEHIREQLQKEGLWTDEGPIVAVNAHASDPHYQPTQEESHPIGRGDWVLIDLWAREPGEEGMFADITWTAYVGEEVPPKHQEVFRAVTGARDAALEYLRKGSKEGHHPHGWEVDKVAREYIARAGYGPYFSHRLGHSLGREVHSNAVNLDSLETHDTRQILPGIAFTIEPGIYLPEFGVRSEIDVFMSEEGPLVTTTVQRDVVLIG